MGGFFCFIHIIMAIKIEFYQLITPVHIAKKYFPKQYENESCWNDGVICTPMGTMNSFDISSIIRECERLGLRRFKEENGERIIGDYYIGTQLNPEKPDVPLNKNDAFQKVQKRHVQEKR